MQVRALHRYARLSAQKARLVAEQIKHLSVDKALDLLTFSPKKAARIIKEVLKSAIANAENNEGADVDELKVINVYVDEGPKLKRMQARAKGRGSRILKPTCHVTVIVGDSRG